MSLGSGLPGSGDAIGASGSNPSIDARIHLQGQGVSASTSSVIFQCPASARSGTSSMGLSVAKSLSLNRSSRPLVKRIEWRNSLARLVLIGSIRAVPETVAAVSNSISASQIPLITGYDWPSRD